MVANWSLIDCLLLLCFDSVIYRSVPEARYRLLLMKICQCMHNMVENGQVLSCGVYTITVIWLSAVGLMPYNFLCVEAGCLLAELSSAHDIFSLGTMLKLTVGAVVTLVPGLLLQRYQQRQRWSQQQQRRNLLDDDKTEWCDVLWSGSDIDRIWVWEWNSNGA